MSDEYNKLLLKLKRCYPEIKVDMQTSGQGLNVITAICNITDNISINENGKYICEDSYSSDPKIADLAKVNALKEALAYAGIDLDAQDVRNMTKLTIFRPTKKYDLRVSWRRGKKKDRFDKIDIKP